MAPDHPHLPPSMHSEMNAGKPWLRSDVLFLTDSLERGMSLVEVAAFLRRPEDEVREKARELEVRLPRGKGKR
jgi:hypothetical protein